MERINPFVVVERYMGIGWRQLGDTPTPALIDASNDGLAHDAYQHPETGFWRLRDDKYDAPGTEYRKVYIDHVPECKGWMDIGHYVPWGTDLKDGRCADCISRDEPVEDE